MKTRPVRSQVSPVRSRKEGRIANLIAHSISPQLVPEIGILPWRSTQLLAVQVHPPWSTPHHVTKLGPEAGVCVRVGSTNRQADAGLIAELKRNAGTESYDGHPVPRLALEGLDLGLAVELLSGIRSFTLRDLQPLKPATVHRGRTVPTVAGVLLMGRDRFAPFPDAYIRTARFDGTTRARVLDMQEIRSPLPRRVDGALAFVARHTVHPAVFGGTTRVDRWTIPMAALREAVVNAILHADYSQAGGPIRLALYDDRLEIENPDLLPAGLTLEDLLRGVSKTRNRARARVFHELRLAEQWGSGIPRMTEACLAAGLGPPELEEFATHFRVTLRPANVVREDRSPRALQERQGAILRLLRERGERGVSSHELAGALGFTDRTARTHLTRLVGVGRVVAIGSAPNDPQRRHYAVDHVPSSPRQRE